jgi:hypothetical protein
VGFAPDIIITRGAINVACHTIGSAQGVACHTIEGDMTFKQRWRSQKTYSEKKLLLATFSGIINDDRRGKEDTR